MFTLHGRLSRYYFFYFAALGAFIPFWGAYLQERGFSTAIIGGLLATLTATKIIAPLLWGWLADHYGHRMRLVQFAALLSIITFTTIYWADSAVTIAITMFSFGFFWHAALPQFEAVTLNHLGHQSQRYAQLRVWGSIGFIVLVVIMGYGINQWGLALIPAVVTVLLIGVWLSTLTVPDCAPAEYHRQHIPPLRTLLAPQSIRWFFISCALMQFSHGGYYAFYSIHLSAAGYSSTTIGLLWALGVGVEVIVFWRMHWLLEHIGARRVLMISLILAVLRWTLIGVAVDSFAAQLIAQTGHAATFGAFHAAAIHLVHQYFPGRAQGRGQALYNSVSFGIGGALGSVSAGLLWNACGAPATFLMAAGAAAAGYYCLIHFPPPPVHNE